MLKKFICPLVASLAMATGAHAVTFANSATSNDVTFFGTGLLTGAPDGGGAFLSDTFDPPTAAGSITFGFDVAIFDGLGADFRLIDVGQLSNELYEVAISADNLSFFSLGIFDTTVGDFDIAGAFAGPFSFIRVTNAGAFNSPDLDAAAALNYRDIAPVPLPAGLPLLLLGMGAFGVASRRKKSS